MPESLTSLMGPANEMRTGWIWRRLSPLKFEGNTVGILLGYHDGRLEMFYFSLLCDRADPAGWPSEKECLADLQILRPALEGQLGVRLDARGCTQFPWGGVSCSYDPKGGSSDVTINYMFFK